MCEDKNTKVSIAKIKACTAPTNISSIKNGTGATYGNKNETMISRTSPAKTFPKSLKENDIILDTSDINSNMPTKKLIGPEKFKNFLRCLNIPSATTPKKFVVKTAITANAKVKFKSAAGDLNSGISSPPTPFSTKDPTPGSNPIQFEASMKIKIVAINGRYFSASSFVPRIEVIRSKSASIPASTTTCIFPGINLMLLLNITANIIKTKETSKPKNRPFVTLKFPMLKICCAFKDIASIWLIKQLNYILIFHKLQENVIFPKAKHPETRGVLTP